MNLYAELRVLPQKWGSGAKVARFTDNHELIK
jgi:hypothetical protein